MHVGEAFKSIDLHLIHNLTIDRLYEQFLKKQLRTLRSASKTLVSIQVTRYR